MTIVQNLQHILAQIKQCDATQAVRLLAVSKTKPVSDILQAYQAGQCAFGENYVQEGVDKINWFASQNIHLEWHLIGPLQSNKTKLVAEHFDWVQTLDRIKIAERLNAQRPAQRAALNVLIQVNISNEESKSGIQPEQLAVLAAQIVQLPRLRLRGLMAIPQANADITQQKETFEKMTALFNQLQKRYPEQPIDTLSMGMSDDMQMAIQCGSTMVRVGSAIFGLRN